jgi:hypothetical protein
LFSHSDWLATFEEFMTLNNSTVVRDDFHLGTVKSAVCLYFEPIYWFGKAAARIIAEISKEILPGLRSVSPEIGVSASVSEKAVSASTEAESPNVTSEHVEFVRVVGDLRHFVEEAAGKTDEVIQLLESVKRETQAQTDAWQLAANHLESRMDALAQHIERPTHRGSAEQDTIQLARLRAYAQSRHRVILAGAEDSWALPSGRSTAEDLVERYLHGSWQGESFESDLADQRKALFSIMSAHPSFGERFAMRVAKWMVLFTNAAVDLIASPAEVDHVIRYERYASLQTKRKLLQREADILTRIQKEPATEKGIVSGRK